MAFNPSSTIYLCNVPFDNTYKNQIYFDTPEDQNAYFTLHTKRSFTDYLTVRKTLPDGSMQSKIKVNANIDELYNINYMYYRNENHGTRVFYAFVNNLIYVNEGTTEIVFETDVWQTWMFDIEIKDSFISREHSEFDEIGDNVVPEKFNFQDYLVYQFPDPFNTLLDKWGYLLTSGETVENVNETGAVLSGIYQGLIFHFFKDVSAMNAYKESMSNPENIVSITVLPEFSVSENALVGNSCVIAHSDKPASKSVSFNLSESATIRPTDKNHAYKNNKLYTFPFYKFVVTNHTGDQAEYKMEDFTDPSNVTFKLYGDISIAPTLTLLPCNYQGIEENLDAGISINGFPQCSYNNDSYKLWLAKNQYSNVASVATGIGQIAAGVGLMGTGVGAAMGVGSIASGASTIFGVINANHQAKLEPNRTYSGAPKNNLLTAMKKNQFDFEIHFLKYDQAKAVDDYFTMYGYQTNKVKKPNLSSRPFFNYVQTIGVNIVGYSKNSGIPNDDMRTLKAMFDNGVTLWKKNATIGDYSVNNSPVKEVNNG